MKRFATILIISLSVAYAQDRLFTFTYQSTVLSKGQKELEIWTTQRESRDKYYSAFDHRIEFEIGLGANLQTAFYLNYGYSKSVISNIASESVLNEYIYSVSNEWKYKLSDPVLSVIGSALYFEYTLGVDKTELEAKVILDRQLGNTLHALNIVGEYEVKKKFTTSGTQINIGNTIERKLLFIYGLSVHLTPNFYAGLELWNKNKFESGSHHYSVFSAGPCLSFSMEGFWANLTILPQLLNFKTGKRELNKNEKLQTRLIFSYVF